MQKAVVVFMMRMELCNALSMVSTGVASAIYSQRQ